jgi:hypothetical protein
MIRMLVLSGAMAFGVASLANAAMMPAPAASGEAAIVKVAEGCGADRWRDPSGHCHWFHTGGGSLRGTVFACPPGWHVGPEGHKCWPNN